MPRKKKITTTTTTINKNNITASNFPIDFNPIVFIDMNSNQKKLTSEFPRFIHFYGCGETEKTYINNVKLGSYYSCSICHDYHIVREIC